MVLITGDARLKSSQNEPKFSQSIRSGSLDQITAECTTRVKI